MLIDSDKLKEELITTNENYCTTKNRGVPFSEIIKIIDNQKEVGGWHTDKPKKEGWYIVAVKIYTSLGQEYDVSFDKHIKNNWLSYKEVVAWQELPKYERGE